MDRWMFVGSGLAVAAWPQPLPRQSRQPGRIVDAADHGATGNCATIETRAIQAAIDAAHRAGGGTVRLRPGLYRSGALFLRSGVTLEVTRGAAYRTSPPIRCCRRALRESRCHDPPRW